MRGRNVGTSVVVLLVSVAGVASASARTSRAVRLVTIHPEGSASHRGIGPVRLEEHQADVTRALGSGHKISSGTEVGETFTEYRYRSGSVTLKVVYGNGLVAGVDTTSPSAVLFGRPLSKGLAAFRAILRGRRGWRIDSCNHRVFTALAPGGPGTGIEWNAGKLEYVKIDVGGVLDDCAAL
jgi:hypothetical protein